MNYDRAAMKREVRQAMRQTRPHPMLVTLLFLVIAGIVAGAVADAGSWLISRFMSGLLSGGGISLEDPVDLLIGVMIYGSDYFGEGLSPELLALILIQATLLISAVFLIFGILITIWNGLMGVGYAGYCLDMAQSADPGLERLFSGFSRAGAVVPASVLVAVFTFLWNLLFGFAYGVVIGILGTLSRSLPGVAPVFALLMLAATAGYIFAIVWVVFRYAMAPYAVIDSRNSLSGLDAIRVSKALMKGRKGRYFVLQLSFIGWYLLECLVVAVGVMIAVIAAFGTVAGYAGQIEQLMSFADKYGSEILYPILLPILFPMLADYYGDVSWITDWLNYDTAWVTDMIGQFTLWILLITMLCGAVIFVINLWLTAYRTGSNARFYIHAADGRSLQPDPQGSRPGQFGPSGVQPPFPPYGVRPEQPDNDTHQPPSGPNDPQY